MKEFAVSAVLTLVWTAIMLSGCATVSHYALVISEPAEQTGCNSVEISRECDNAAERIAEYDSGTYVVVPIFLEDDWPANRVVFAEKTKLDLLAAGDADYAKQLTTWLVDSRCYGDLAKHFTIWP